MLSDDTGRSHNLMDTFPKMFRNPYWPEHLEGWDQLVFQLCHDIQDYIDTNPGVEQITVTQIKEKFGSLRFYCDNADDTIFGLIRAAEIASYSLCEQCGEPGTTRRGGWMRTLCDTHEAEHQTRLTAHHIKKIDTEGVTQ